MPLAQNDTSKWQSRDQNPNLTPKNSLLLLNHQADLVPSKEYTDAISNYWLAFWPLSRKLEDVGLDFSF